MITKPDGIYVETGQFDARIDPDALRVCPASGTRTTGVWQKASDFDRLLDVTHRREVVIAFQAVLASCADGIIPPRINTAY